MSKLEQAIENLQKESIACEAFPCDVSDAASVRRLAKHTAECGKVNSVIHAAGLSPHMGDAAAIMTTNALGTIYINTEFAIVMEEGSCILDVSSMSAYLTPAIVIPRRRYRYSLTDTVLFFHKSCSPYDILPSCHNTVAQ